MDVIFEIKNKPFNQKIHKNTNINNEKITIPYFTELPRFWAE